MVDRFGLPEPSSPPALPRLGELGALMPFPGDARLTRYVSFAASLAREIEGDLLQRVSDDTELQMLVQQSEGFESALGLLERDIEQGKGQAQASYVRLRDAVLGSFREMNLGLADLGSLEFSNDRLFSASRFLARFDAIFTLNQDLLLEMFYDPSLEDSRRPRWNGRYFPGVSPYQPKTRFKTEFVDANRSIMGPPIQENPYCQPIFKLHGSVDWFDQAGRLIVMGGAKQSMIDKRPLLAKYFEEFLRRLREPGARVMIIGYGFRDAHVNTVLGEACAANPSLSAFYVDPQGRQVARGSAPGASPR